MKHNILSLDFWQDTVIYGSKTFPSGTLGCDALNIPTKVIEQLNDLCIALNLLMGTLNAGCGNPALLPVAKESAKQIADLLKNVKPFSYAPTVFYAKISSEKMISSACAFRQLRCCTQPSWSAALSGPGFCASNPSMICSNRHSAAS